MAGPVPTGAEDGPAHSGRPGPRTARLALLPETSSDDAAGPGRLQRGSLAGHLLGARIDHGIFRWLNEGGDAVTIADRYNQCFIVDDQTVARTDGTSSRSAAGIVIDVDADGVWVQTVPGQV